MKIAIIGSGISGLGAAYLLHPQHEITIYEKNDYIGGHSRTIELNAPEGGIPVDTGFIVFNYRNYPHLTGLFNQLEVPVAKSDMSFAASINDGWLEYGTQSLTNIFAQKCNFLRPQFYGMIRDILRFNKASKRYLEKDANIGLGQALDELGMGEWFRHYYLMAMGAAIWSTPLMRMDDFPAKTFVRFFDNHGLLTINDQPQWYTVQGGSREYVRRLTASFANNIKLNTAVTSVRRETEQVIVTDASGVSKAYDQVVMATHADQSIKMLENPTSQEQQLLGNVRYQPNEIIAHSDTSFMPKRKDAWASWVYLSDDKKDAKTEVSLSYWMNKLQPLPTQMPVIVTLNPGREPDPALVHDRHQFEHPLFDEAAIQTQERISEIQGADRIWYCGAWQRYGFHEDGLLSAVNIAQTMGATIPWK